MKAGGGATVLLRHIVLISRKLKRSGLMTLGRKVVEQGILLHGGALRHPKLQTHGLAGMIHGLLIVAVNMATRRGLVEMTR